MSETFPDWLRPELAPGVDCLVTTRASAGYADFNLASHAGDQQQVVQNRDAASRSLGGVETQWLNQVHGADCVYCDRVTQVPPDADAAWTDRTELTLALLTADCVPVLMASRDGSLIGVAHAGWQGLVSGVIENLVESLPSVAANLVAWIGPCIGSAAYEVGEEVWRCFADAYLSEHPDPGKRRLDLAAVAHSRLSALGVSEVRQAGICVFANDKYYSHRASRQQGRPEGRFASMIVRRRSC